jgi:1-aminocyclopropane-1-carboxylate deaminase
MLEKFERHPLTFGPTPIEKLSRLSEHLGGAVEVYAKREDCNSGLAFGGNKLRKLEYIVPDIIRSGADTLVTVGGVQSNHTRQVAAVAARLGMKCRLVQESWVPFPDAVYDRVGNILLSRLMGAEIELVDEEFDIGIRQAWERALEDVKARGGKPYPIPAGASVHKYGGLGFVGFAEEVRAQEAQMGVVFDYVVVCTVTGSTHAGMVVGFARDGRSRNVIGIDASFTPDQARAQVLQIARATADLVELGRDITNDDVVLEEAYAHPAYGVPSAATNDAIRLCARLEGMITDPVYEGKSMQGLIDLVRRGFFPAAPGCCMRTWEVFRPSTGTAICTVTGDPAADGRRSHTRESFRQPQPPALQGGGLALRTRWVGVTSVVWCVVLERVRSLSPEACHLADYVTEGKGPAPQTVRPSAIGCQASRAASVVANLRAAFLTSSASAGSSIVLESTIPPTQSADKASAI